MQQEEKVVILEQEFRRRFVYDETDQLGVGGFAKVYKAYDRQFDETVALKFYTKTDVDKYDIITEMRRSRRYTHKNIIRVHDARIVRFTNSMGLTEDIQVGILEYANAGDLHDFLNSTPSEAEFKAVVAGILRGLQYIHAERKVIHRDLSPDNILMMKENDVWIPKIADFGISKQVDIKTMNLDNSKVSSELVGKLEYMAPEQFAPDKYGINGKLATNVDLWSFGIILTEIFTEKTPFGARSTSQSPMEIMHNITHRQVPAYIKRVSEPYNKIIQRCLIKDARKRVQNSNELLAILDQPLEKKGNNKKVIVLSLICLLLVAGLVGWFTVQNSDAGKSEKPVVKNTNKIEPPVIEPVVIDSSDVKKTTVTDDDEKRETPVVDPEPINPIAKPVAESEDYSELFSFVLREIESSDNDDLPEALRRNRIPRYIDRYFIGDQATVTVFSNGQAVDYKVDQFFQDVVNTSNKIRKWSVNESRTIVRNDKIKELVLTKTSSQ